MQFLVKRDHLVDALAKLAAIIDPKSGVPILHNVLIDAGAASLYLRATDCDLQLKLICPAEVQKQGQITVDGRLLHDIARKCPKAGQIAVAFHKKTERLNVKSGRAEFHLATLPADDWPIYALQDGAARFELECRQMRALIEKTQFAISRDETRYYLNGIYLHALGEQLAAVATDGHRLALKTVPLPAGADDMPAPRGEEDGTPLRAKGDGFAGWPGVILPRDAASAALKILPDSEVTCEVACGGNLWRLSVGEVELISKLIDGTFPDWQRVMPRANEGRVIAPREALQTALARVATVLDERDHGVKLALGEDAINLTGFSSAFGHSARELVEQCNSNMGAVGLALAANARYLAELLDALDGAQIALCVNTPADPVLFEEVDGDGGFKAILMPMALLGALAKSDDETKKKAA